MNQAYRSFRSGEWKDRIDVRNFIQTNVTPYTGGSEFLAGPTAKTKVVWERCLQLLDKEHKAGGVLAIDANRPTTITSHGPGYIDRENEVIVGLQTDEPLKRAINPWGGIRMAVRASRQYGYDVDPEVSRVFTDYRRTHNDGVFKAYTKQMKLLRHTGLLTGLPDAYGRGRIIGDYRRVALYGVDRLIASKEEELNGLTRMNEATIRLREEISDQITALKDLKAMALEYGFDLSMPARSATETAQWLYFGYLAAIKQQNGAAMSIGRINAFLDIYVERDLSEGTLTEELAQEIVDQLVIKLRLVRQLRTEEYNALFSGDPNWVTEAIGGMAEDGRTLVTKTAFRILNTLYNLGPAPEPNLTVLWSTQLPRGFKEFCAKVAADTSSIQFENDDLMRPRFGDDYGIACCVSAMKLGRQMQFFGARANLPKALLVLLNGGRDEREGLEVAPRFLEKQAGVLDYMTVRQAFSQMLQWLASVYVDTMNVIHYMHDKYAYESILMALHDADPERLMAFGMAGLSVLADSFAAIKYAQVTPVYNEDGLVVDFEVKGDYPQFGNNDPRVDDIAQELVAEFSDYLRQQETYRGAQPTLSILTITSNVVYGKKTGATPDGRKAGEPFAPGANPMHGRDRNGALASLNSVAKIRYDDALDGISYTFSIAPKALGKTDEHRAANLSGLIDGYFTKQGHHININVFDRELLMDAMEHPEKYPQLTIRVSGYAVNFVKLTREQQEEVIQRTIHSTVA